MKKPKKLILYSIIVTVVLVLGYFFLGILVDDYCNKKAQEIVGKDWAKMLDPTKEEIEYSRGLTAISAGYREEIKCYKNFNLLDVIFQIY